MDMDLELCTRPARIHWQLSKQARYLLQVASSPQAFVAATHSEFDIGDCKRQLRQSLDQLYVEPQESRQ